MDKITKWLALRRRTIILFAALFVVLILGAWPVSRLVIADFGSLLGGKLYQTEVGEALWARLLVSFAMAAALELTVMGFVFIRRPFEVGAAALLFCAGAAFARFLLLPPAITVLTGALGGDYELRITISGYVGFCLLFMLLLGLLCEEPLLVRLLYKMGLVDAVKLRAGRKGVYLAVLIAMAVLTPSQDAVTLVLAMLPFLVLYESSILWLAALESKKEAADG